MEISENGLKLLKFYKEKNYGIAVYAVPAEQLAWFGNDAVACEQAQIELEEVGLLELGDMPPRHFAVSVRGAALTREGLRAVQTLGETAT